MSALTAAYEGYRKDGQVQHYGPGAVNIYKGALVSVRAADGYAYPSRSGTSTDVFVGVAYESALNSAGSANAFQFRVNKSGSYLFNTTVAAQTWVGSAVYASDDNTVTQTSTNNQLVGYVTEYVSSTVVRVRIDRAVQ